MWICSEKRKNDEAAGEMVVCRDVAIRPHLLLGASDTKYSGHISPMCMKLAPVHCRVWDLMLRKQENNTTCKT